MDAVRRQVACISAVLVLSPNPAAAQSVGAYATDSVEAHADWVSRPTRRAPRFRFVKITKDTEPAGAAFTMAEVGTVRCSSAEERASFRYSCVVRGRLIFIRSDAFRFDPALRSARAQFKAFGRTNRVRWTARNEPPQRDWTLHGGERAIVVSAALRAGSKVRGRVLGRPFSTAGNDAHASLRRVAEAGVIYDTSTRTLTVERRYRAAAWKALRKAIVQV